MGSIFKKAKKAVKKFAKKVTKPITKVFKGVAKGIARVGKAVMRGISKISNKLGPLGMIALSVAMPYALGGLSSIVGTGAMSGMHPATGLMGSKWTFLRAVGNVGNQIRTGYQIGSGMIGDAVSFATKQFASLGNSITDTIAKTFQKFSGSGAGGKDNWWTRISKGAKNLFNSAKSVVTGQPKVGTVQIGGESVGGLAKDSFTLSSEAASELIAKGGINLSQPGALSNQTLGFTTRASDKLITETINKAAEKQISQLSPNAYKYYNDINNAYKANNTYLNNQQALDAVLESQSTSYQGITDFDGLYNTDLGMTGDYKLLNPNEPTSYTFTGDKTFDNPVAKKFKYKETINKAKKATYKWAKDSLLNPIEWSQPESYKFEPTKAAEFARSTGAALSATDIKGSTGSSSYAKVFGDAAWEQLKTYHKHMNYQGSSPLYNEVR
jgi:hypothetical protein